jgi:hypothetical protein
MEPEVIVKQQFLIDATGKVAYAVPEILLLGNREGLRHLGEWLLEQWTCPTWSEDVRMQRRLSGGRVDWRQSLGII